MREPGHMWISASLLFSFLVAVAAPGLHRASPRFARYILPVAPLVLTIYFCTLLPSIVNGEVARSSLRWVPELGVSLSWHVDGLSLLLSILIAGLGTLVISYAGTYLEGHPDLGRLYGFLFLFMASMLGLVLADNTLALFVFWELTSLSSYFLIGFDHDSEAARAAALQALLVTASGGLALLGAAVLLARVTGTYELSEIAEPVRHELLAHTSYPAIVLLVFAAAFTKSAQFPFHFWLPRAMEAPTPVSAYLHSATMVKAGVYLLARLNPTLSGSSLWHQPLLWIGAVTAVMGGALALGETHLKRILAYSTVGALGMLVLLIGLGTAAAARAHLVFLLAHALYKGALFLSAGSVAHAAHESDVERLGGLRAALPITALAAGLAALSMGGLPPFLNYLAKELVFTIAVDTNVVLAGCAVGASALFLAAAWSTGIRPFWARSAGSVLPAREVPWALWSPPLLLAVLGLVCGVRPEIVEGLVNAATQAILPGAASAHLVLWHGIGWPLVLSIATIAIGFGIYRYRRALRRFVGPVTKLAGTGPARGYEAALSALNIIASTQTRLLQRGYLRGYLSIILLTTLVLVAYTLLRGEAVAAPLSLEDLRPHEAVTAALILVGTATAIRARSRFAAIISLGIVGYGVALFFIFLGAPDLGITQLVVETLTVILLILAFYHLPEFAELSPRSARFRDMLLAVGFGALMTALVFVASQTQVSSIVSDYYREASLPKAHGRNVVNVILTDFRALDTLGEITVLATAGLGVFALLKFTSRGAPIR